MYRINDKTEAKRRVQNYLRAVSPGVFVAPSGVFDENTRLALIAFQEKMNLEPSGMVDLDTFEMLFSEYSLINMKKRVEESIPGAAHFPLSIGDMSEIIFSINNNLARMLDYYGIIHRLRASSFYSQETAQAVRELRRIYMLEDSENIDEIFYFRLINDLDSISNFRRNE